jgi:MFS family permease
MMPQLSEAFGLDALGVASLVGLFYYGYSPFSLVAGVALDRLGARRVIPIGAAIVSIGSLLFATGDTALAGLGRFLQGAGGVFALVGAVYIASSSFPASQAATLIGATQMFGMAGGSAGQFLVGPAMSNGLPWRSFWIAMAVIGAGIAVVLVLLLPSKAATPAGDWRRAAVDSLRTVFRNPQSILCGLIAGLLMMPTSIFDMVWGVRYLQDTAGHEYGEAVMRSATVPLGWIIGSPLLGWLSDRLGRRKPVVVGAATVLFACLAWILFGRADVLPPYLLGIVTGVASSCVMLLYTVIKEANPPELNGTATGVVNFLNFTLSALFGPVFAALLHRASNGSGKLELAHYQMAFGPMLGGVGVAIALALMLKETGPAANRS